MKKVKLLIGSAFLMLSFGFVSACAVDTNENVDPIEPIADGPQPRAIGIQRAYRRVDGSGHQRPNRAGQRRF